LFNSFNLSEGITHLLTLSITLITCPTKRLETRGSCLITMDDAEISAIRRGIYAVKIEIAEIKAEIATLRTTRNGEGLTDHKISELTNELIANINHKVALTYKEVELLKRLPGKFVELS
jgi:hypothetical protein